MRIFICECQSFTHQSIFWYDDEAKQLYVTIHLTRTNFFQRLLKGVKYIFGYSSNFGEWDEFIFKWEDEQNLLNYLKEKYTLNQ